MPLEYEASEQLLLEIWSALREPVKPLQSALASEAIRECFARASHAGEDKVRACLESILFFAAGNRELAPNARTELAAIFGTLSRQHLERSEGNGHLLALPGLSPARIAAFCAMLEMLGFDVNSGEIYKAANAELDRQRKRGETAMRGEIYAGWIEERFKQRVRLRVRSGRGHEQVLTLRTHKGFIIQAYLDGDLAPVRLDVFGPKYNAVSDWMGLLSANAAWSLELRDAPGYDPGIIQQKPFGLPVMQPV